VCDFFFGNPHAERLRFLIAFVRKKWTEKHNENLEEKAKSFCRDYSFRVLHRVPKISTEEIVLSHKFRALRTRFILLGAVTVALSACSLETDVSDPASIAIIQGDGQTVATNTLLPTDLGVVVVTQLGEPVPSEPVQWTIVSGGGTLNPVLSQTNEDGVATTSFTTGPTAGNVKITAKAGNLLVTFDVIVS
jgi:Big-like domain-containing protein